MLQPKKETPQERIAQLTPQQRLGARLKELRMSKGYSSSEKFALAINLNRTQYHSYEMGKGDIQFTTLVKIVAGLEISLKDFFSEGFES